MRGYRQRLLVAAGLMAGTLAASAVMPQVVDTPAAKGAVTGVARGAAARG
ncbi:hypothetical protein AB2M62_13570 [Sphingomonas sp. MMS12-HWE2-04]